uniref:Soul heme-binding family protein n=1 Tax=Solanum tuberosum TaxID=4113 RepID=M1CQN6_SOLTU
MAVNRSSSAPAQRRNGMSALEARISLVIALASQTSSLSQKLLTELASETAKYVFPKRIFESRNLEEALMSVPDLETVKFKVLKLTDQYEIREVEPYFVAEATMPGKSGFDLNGASQSFNTLAEFLFEHEEGEYGNDDTCNHS